MSEDQIPPGISAEDWAATPPAVKAWVLSLLETVATLQKRLAELEERVNQNPRNSSKPPSSDPPNAPPRPTAVPSGRKAGGQPGHVGHGRLLKPVAQVSQVVVARPTACAACGALLLGEDAQPVRHQVTDLPRIQPGVTEYQRHTVTCLACGKTGRTCARILKLEVALWTFVRVEGVEPTNNGAERPLRRAVVWRRRSFWTQSADGSRFVERILTVVTTLRQQKRDVLDYLTEACAAAIRGDPPPSLLPKPSALDAAT